MGYSPTETEKELDRDMRFASEDTQIVSWNEDFKPICLLVFLERDNNKPMLEGHWDARTIQ